MLLDGIYHMVPHLFYSEPKYNQACCKPSMKSNITDSLGNRTTILYTNPVDINSANDGNLTFATDKCL